MATIRGRQTSFSPIQRQGSRGQGEKPGRIRALPPERGCVPRRAGLAAAALQGRTPQLIPAPARRSSVLRLVAVTQPRSVLPDADANPLPCAPDFSKVIAWSRLNL